MDVGADAKAASLAAADQQQLKRRLGGDAVKGGVEVVQDARREGVDLAVGHVEDQSRHAVGELVDPQIFRLKKGHVECYTALAGTD